VTLPNMVETMTCAASFLRFDARSTSWVAIDAPDKVAETYLARRSWRLPVLTGVTGTPFLRRDGTVYETPGYDAASGLLYKPDCEFPRIPLKPRRGARRPLDAHYDAVRSAMRGGIAS
jgi:hypothetical protein